MLFIYIFSKHSNKIFQEGILQEDCNKLLDCSTAIRSILKIEIDHITWSQVIRRFPGVICQFEIF